MNSNPASKTFDDSLDDSEAKTNPITVHLRSSVQFAVPGEQFWQVLCTDTYSSVVHMNHEVLLLQVVASHDFDLPLSCELFCILD
jgi:hypothetical protein